MAVQDSDERRRRHAKIRTGGGLQATIDRLRAKHPPKEGQSITQYLKTRMAEGHIDEFRTRTLLRGFLDMDVVWLPT